MSVHALQLETSFVVIVYDKIDRRQVSRGRLQEMIPGQSPRFIDMPGGPLVVDFEALPGTSCVIDSRRIFLNQLGTTEPGKGHLARMAMCAADAIGDAVMNAYGKNYVVRGSIEAVEHVGAFLRDAFLNDVEELERRVGGSISWLSPRVKYVVEGTEYELRLDPDLSEEAMFRAQLNIHHATKSLPDANALSSELNEGFAYFQEILDKVLTGGAAS